MLFNSFAFLIFLPIVFCLYWYVFKSLKWQNLLVVAASYFFYGWWDWRFLILIAFTTLCSFGSGILFEHYKGQRLWQRAISATNIILNLGILGVFKYFNFFVDNLNELFSTFGWHLDWATMNLILPVGISFYTFQALSYSIDVYRGKLPATKDIVAFFAYISFFPQLVAGPIERATNLLPQFQKGRVFCYNYAVEGCRQMLWGFFKKIVIADNCAIYANIAFDNYNECGSHSLILGAIFFSFQIYCDFSGYSSIAIGCAKLFGISLRTNFRVPYFSRDIAEFWRRWHISLNKWFVDYVYIPLGGSRVSKKKVVRNIFIIFLLSGLWHGANWTYVSWGLYHACLFLPLIITCSNKRFTGDFSEKWFPSFRDGVGIITTFIFATIGWILFRSQTIGAAWEYMKGIFAFRPNGSSFVSVLDSLWLICAITFMLVVEWINRNSRTDLHIVPRNKIVRNTFYMILIAVAYISYMLSIEDDNTFIYFQF